MSPRIESPLTKTSKESSRSFRYSLHTSTLAHPNVNRLLSSSYLLPLKETISQHKAPVLFEGSAEGWFCRHGLAARINQAVPNLLILSTKRNQSPACSPQLRPTITEHDNAGLLSRREVVARNKINFRLLNAHTDKELLVALCICVTTTHREENTMCCVCARWKLPPIRALEAPSLRTYFFFFLNPATRR